MYRLELILIPPFPSTQIASDTTRSPQPVATPNYRIPRLTSHNKHHTARHVCSCSLHHLLCPSFRPYAGFLIHPSWTGLVLVLVLFWSGLVWSAKLLLRRRPPRGHQHDHLVHHGRQRVAPSVPGMGLLGGEGAAAAAYLRIRRQLAPGMFTVVVHHKYAKRTEWYYSVWGFRASVHEGVTFCFLRPFWVFFPRNTWPQLRFASLRCGREPPTLF